MTDRKKRLSALCITLVMLFSILSLPVSAAHATDVEWSGTFTGTNNNTVTTAALPSESGKTELAWSSEVGNNTVVIVDDAIYTYDGVNPYQGYDAGGTFCKIDKDTGEVLKTLECAVSTDFYYSYSIYADGLIYVGCPTTVMAFDPDTFTMKWSTTVTTRIYSTLQYVNGCIVTNGTVLDAQTGAKKAELTGEWSGGWSNGAEVGGYFYVADATESVYAVDTATWKVKDTLTTGLSVSATCPGVMYDNGSLYWGGVSGNAYCVKVSDGTFVSEMQTVNCGIKCYSAPVAANGRVYLVGMADNAASTNTGAISICVFDAATMELLYSAHGNETGKIQSTPVLCRVSSDEVRVYVQGYQKPGNIYYLADTTAQNSGSLTLLLAPEQSQYAWEQIACDSDGAIYCSNDAGYLMKYQSKKAPVAVTGGDVNGDGKVNIRDAVTLSRYFADWDVTIVEENSDLNGDGICDTRDLVMLRRYLAGWYD